MYAINGKTNGERERAVKELANPSGTNGNTPIQCVVTIELLSILWLLSVRSNQNITYYGRVC